MDERIKRALYADAEIHCLVSLKTWDDVKSSAFEEKLQRRISMLRRAGYSTAAAVFTGLMVLAGGFVSPAMAQVLRSVPIVGSMYQFKDPAVQMVATTSQSSATYKGITITVPSAYYDNNQIQFVYNISVPSGYSPSQYSQIKFDPSTWTLNGRPLRASGMNGDNLVGDHMYHGDAEFQLTSSASQESGTLVISIEQVGSVKGKWILSVPISSRKVVAQQHSSHSPMSKSYDGLTLTVESVTVGPINTIINYELTQTTTNGHTKYTMEQPWFTFPVFDDDHKIMWETGSDMPSTRHVDGSTKVWDFTEQYKSPAQGKANLIYVEPNYNSETGGWSKTIPQLEMMVTVK